MKHTLITVAALLAVGLSLTTPLQAQDKERVEAKPAPITTSAERKAERAKRRAELREANKRGELNNMAGETYGSFPRSQTAGNHVSKAAERKAKAAELAAAQK